MEGDEIVRLCDRISNETVTFNKYVTKYIHMRQFMVEFFRKFENHAVKIARVTRFASQINQFALIL